MWRVRCRHADGSETVREFPTLYLAKHYIDELITRGNAVACVAEPEEED